MELRCMQADHQNQLINGCCLDSTCPNQRPYCNSCLPSHVQHIQKLKSLEIVNEWIQEQINCVKNVEKKIKDCQQSLESLNLLIPKYDFNIQQFSEIGVSQIDNIIRDLSQIEKCEEILFQQLKQYIEQIKSIIDQILRNIKNQTNQKEKTKIQLFNSDEQQQMLEQQQDLNILKESSNKFTFELMNENTIKQDDLCYAIAFNIDQSIVLAGCGKDIKVFQNNQGKLNQMQLLKQHKKRVFTLNFLEKTNNFVSGGDNLIIIWQMIENKQWNCQQILEEHLNWITCLLLNKTAELIISSSQDKTIKFWMKENNQWLSYQTITDHSYIVYSLSLNEQQNKLISCSYDKSILVIEQSSLNKQWSVTQKIEVDQHGRRLCFINDTQFTFQPYCQEQMHIYEYEANNKQYSKTKEIAVKCSSDFCDYFFPQQYQKEKCLLVNKNGKNVNIIQKKENGDFLVLQSIEFSSEVIYGQLSDDGEYLIIFIENEIQIRRCQKI
ncbi:unnamed protein product [Paramecium sonneborni]|uniref:WD40-repeat-containing domain n=1 Tax=Paramecium sonneborni TaxID=65129 RepID=A0A8S1RGP5_9CILI|nr:unnamed protein product [Paramecium sonneborni]